VRLVAAAEDDADDLLEAVREGARRTVRDEAELLNRAQDALARVGPRRSVAIQNAGYRGNGDAGLTGYVVDRQRALGPLGLWNRPDL
jgi:hypothetical protein